MSRKKNLFSTSQSIVKAFADETSPSHVHQPEELDCRSVVSQNEVDMDV